MRFRKADPASPSLIDPTAPAQPLEEFAPEQVSRAGEVLRGIRILQFMGMNDDYIVQDAVARLRRRAVVVLP